MLGASLPYLLSSNYNLMELVSLFPHFIGKESESQTWGKLAKISGGIIQVLLDGQASSLENGGKRAFQGERGADLGPAQCGFRLRPEN